MALIILEGLDRTGKTSVAKFFEDKGYEIVHMSAPAKGTSSATYLGEMVDLLTSCSGKDIVFDRSHYGELVWPNVYNRVPLLDDEDMEALREIEESLEVERILMHDPNVDAHWKRCVDNKEPLTKAQFVKARTLYSNMADKYGFIKKTINDFPQAAALSNQVSHVSPSTSDSEISKDSSLDRVSSESVNSSVNRTPQQLKLDKANAINEVLAKRIIKGKGQLFDDLERSIRGFLNNELGKIFGASQSGNEAFTKEEVELLKFFCDQLKNKRDKENT